MPVEKQWLVPHEAAGGAMDGLVQVEEGAGFQGAQYQQDMLAHVDNEPGNNRLYGN